MFRVSRPRLVFTLEQVALALHTWSGLLLRGPPLAAASCTASCPSVCVFGIGLYCRNRRIGTGLGSAGTARTGDAHESEFYKHATTEGGIATTGGVGMLIAENY